MKINLIRFIKKNIGLIAYLLFFVIFTILLPVLFLFNSVNIERELFLEIGLLTIISIISGCVATILTLVRRLLYPFSRMSLILNIGIQVQFFVYILLWAQFWKFEISLEYFYLMMDLSNIYVFLSVIPLLILIRIIFLYVIGYRKAKINAIVLYALKNGNFNSKNQIRRYFNQINFKLSKTDNKIIQIIETLESKKKNLIIKKKKYQLTKKGNEFLNWFETHRNSSLAKIVVTPKSGKIEIPLQVWTEEELKEYNKKR